MSDRGLKDSFGASVSFEMDSENATKLLRITIDGLLEKITRIERELKQARNELCLKCGNYHESYAGACDGCRYRRGGEWEADLNV